MKNILTDFLNERNTAISGVIKLREFKINVSESFALKQGGTLQKSLFMSIILRTECFTKDLDMICVIKIKSKCLYLIHESVAFPN